MPWDSSLTVSLSGQRVAAIRLRRSISCASGTLIRKSWIDLSSVNMGGVAESGLLMEALTSVVGAVWAKLGRANTARPNTPTPARIATKLRRLSANDARLLRNPSPRLPVVADLEVN